MNDNPFPHKPENTNWAKYAVGLVLAFLAVFLIFGTVSANSQEKPCLSMTEIHENSGSDLLSYSILDSKLTDAMTSVFTQYFGPPPYKITEDTRLLVHKVVEGKTPVYFYIDPDTECTYMRSFIPSPDISEFVEGLKELKWTLIGKGI